MNNKGFMMAEVVVVAAIVMVTLSSLYISYGKLYSSYSSRLNYYDVRTLYDLAYYKDTNNLSGMFASAAANTYSIQSSAGYESGETNTVILINNRMSNIGTSSQLGIDSSSVNRTYLDYIDYVSSAINLTNTDYVLLMERCNSDATVCKYAYLEVYE